MIAEGETMGSKDNDPGGSAGGVYLLGAIGAGIYYWKHAEDDPASRARAVGKAIAWPAFIVYSLLEHLEGVSASVDDA